MIQKLMIVETRILLKDEIAVKIEAIDNVQIIKLDFMAWRPFESDRFPIFSM
jgi:hypothetical protein